MNDSLGVNLLPSENFLQDSIKNTKKNSPPISIFGTPSLVIGSENKENKSFYVNTPKWLKNIIKNFENGKN